MAALFHKFSNDQILKNSVGSGSLTICQAFDKFNQDPSNIAIISNVGIRIAETVQFFQSFDDLIHYYYFGKGLGSVTFTIMLFQSCDSSEAPGIPKLLDELGSIRGTETLVSVGNKTFTGILTDFTISIESEPETHYVAQINLAIIDHTLQSPSPPETSC